MRAPADLPPAKYAAIPRYEKGGDILPPKVLRRRNPEPAPELRATRNAATATVELLLDEHGTVVDAWYVARDREWAQSLITATRGWKFEPASRNGQPTAVRFRVSSEYHRN